MTVDARVDRYGLNDTIQALVFLTFDVAQHYPELKQVARVRGCIHLELGRLVIFGHDVCKAVPSLWD